MAALLAAAFDLPFDGRGGRCRLSPPAAVHASTLAHSRAPALDAAQVTAATRAAFATGLRAAPWRWLLHVLAAWVGITLLFTAQRIVRAPEQALVLIGTGLVSFAPCVVLTPAVAWSTLRYRFIRGQRSRAVVAHLLGAAGFSVLGGAMMGALAWALPWSPAPARLVEAMAWAITTYLDVDVLVYVLIVACVLAVAYAREARDRAVAAAELQTQLATAQLHTLTAQLQPHFLFNTLNAIASLVRHEPRRAEQLVNRLSDLLRHSLERAHDPESTLDEEIDFLEQYVEIQETRYGSRLRIAVRIDDDARRLLVPRLILQPLVENAIRHGVLRRAGPGRVEVTARREEDVLVLVVEDDGVGLPSDAPPAEGVGLSVTRSRLQQLYGTAQSFVLGAAPGRGVRCVIRIPCRPAGAP